MTFAGNPVLLLVQLVDSAKKFSPNVYTPRMQPFCKRVEVEYVHSLREGSNDDATNRTSGVVWFLERFNVWYSIIGLLRLIVSSLIGRSHIADLALNCNTSVNVVHFVIET